MARPGGPRGQDSRGVRLASSLFRSDKGAMKRLSRYGLFVASLLVVLLLQACQRRVQPIYSYYQSLDGEEWAIDDELFYTFSASPGERYLVEGVVRVTPDFALRQIPLGVVLETPDHHFEESKVMLPITPAKLRTTGYIVREYPFAIISDFRPDTSSFYTISLRPLLRDSVIRGVIEVGVTVTPSR